MIQGLGDKYTALTAEVIRVRTSPGQTATRRTSPPLLEVAAVAAAGRTSRGAHVRTAALTAALERL